MGCSVLHLSSSRGVFGAENVLLCLAREMQGSSYHPTVGVIKNSSDRCTEVADHAVMNGIKAVIFPCLWKFDPVTLFLMRRYITRERIDVIHCHGYKADLYGLAASNLTGTRLVATAHNWTKANRKLSLYACLDKLLLRYFDCVVTVSEELKAELVGASVEESKIKTIMNGIHVNKYRVEPRNDSLREELGIGRGAKVVGCVGRLSAEKGIEFLLDSVAPVLKECSNTWFLVVGDGPLLNALKEMCASMESGDHVVFAGRRSEVERCYDLMDIVVVPSVREGFPVVVLEAMVLQKPLICTRVGAIPKVIEHGTEGLLVEHGNVRELTGSIVYLLKNGGIAGELGGNAYRKVVKEYSAEAMSLRYFEVYDQLCSDRK